MKIVTRKKSTRLAVGASAASRRPSNGASSSRRSKVAKWGNSLGFRIPQEAAERLGLREGGQVSVEIHPTYLTIRPVRPARKRWSEAELLKGVTPEIVGGEVDWGSPVGKEVA